MTLRKSFQGDFKKIELTLGTAERKAKERIVWKKGVAALSSMDSKERRRKNLYLNEKKTKIKECPEFCETTKRKMKKMIIDSL